MPEKKELQKTISGKFSIDEAKQIDDTLKELGINRNQMIRESVIWWMQVKPLSSEFTNTKFMTLIKKIQSIQNEALEAPKIKKMLRDLEKNLDDEELSFIEQRFKVFEKRAKKVSIPKKQGRPSTRKKKKKFVD